MTPEDVLGALVTHSQCVQNRKPDPLVMENRAERIGKRVPLNWRLHSRASGLGVEVWPAVRSARGHETHRVSRFSFHTVAADALIGMHERNWQTLQVAIGVGDASRSLLLRKLCAVAKQSRKHDQFWPRSIRRRACACGRLASDDYIADVAQLCLLQLENPVFYGTHRSRAEWFGISERHWRGVMQRPFDAVSAHLWSWYHAGIGHIQNRIIRSNSELAQSKIAAGSTG